MRLDCSSGISSSEAVVALFILIVVGVGAYYVGVMGVSNSPVKTDTTTVTTTPLPPAQVAVSGNVSTVVYGSYPSAIQFVSDETGISYPGIFSSGNYSVSLPNPGTYTVEIHWKTAINAGDCSAGVLSLRIDYGGSAVVENWKC